MEMKPVSTKTAISDLQWYVCLYNLNDSSIWSLKVNVPYTVRFLDPSTRDFFSAVPDVLFCCLPAGAPARIPRLQNDGRAIERDEASCAARDV